MERPWTFTQRIGAGFFALLLVALVLAGTSVVALMSVRTNNKARILDLSMDLLEVERLRRAFSDKVSSGRGYALSKDPLFEQDMAVSRQRFIATYQRLKPRLDGEPLAALLESAVHAELEHEEAVQALLTAANLRLNREQLEDIFEARVGQTRQRAFDALRLLAERSEERLSQGIQDAVEADERVMLLILLAAGLGLTVAGALAWVLTRRLRPLQREAEVSARRFQSLVEGVQDYAIYLLDAQGRVASWNPGAQRIKGYSEREVLGRSASIFYTPESVRAGQPEMDLTRARRDGRLRMEGWRVRKDGTRFLAEVIITALHDSNGQLQGFAHVSRDITERRRTEQTQRLLAEAGRLFHQFLDPDLTVSELARLMVPEVADVCILFLLTPSGELMPRTVKHADADKEQWVWESLRRYPPSPETSHGIWEVLRSGHSELFSHLPPEVLAHGVVDAEHLSLLQKVGIESYLAVPLRVGEQKRGVFALLSATPERRLTVTDQVFVEELAGRAALALDNARLFREAQQAVELIGVAAHDLGNPLNTLQLLLRRLHRMELPRGSEKVREGLGTALKQTQRLGQLLLNLLDLSRLSSGKLLLDVAPVDLAELAHEVVERFAEQAEEAGCKLVFDAELGLVGRWDRLRLDRVVTNLLSNALKFGKGRPVEVRVERVGAQRARLRVKDQGQGIALASQGRIFNRFEREPSAGKHAGFGLGLYIVRQLVEAHGGVIRVESTPGEGACFVVELPLMQPGAELGPDMESPGPPGPV
ncbi:PAS domain S-box protein [Pyxidicoccus parkwayensis]|uniref:histidine kinase n=1 Tax=Pyxidicoccus parkwayensis TaxID=2813578 RepID=A0ABX7NZ87_9BACT|nr:ATP-binding protein [Pyxidicoccus parkwaysis]QSQ21383.1 PAS domain S-box protein [Pyxidicoccus parkwaysis]